MLLGDDGRAVRRAGGARYSGPGPPRRDRRHRQVRRDPRTRRRAGRRGGAGRSGSRPDRGPCRGAGGAHRRAERGRRRAAGQHRHHRRPAGAGLGRRRGRRTRHPSRRAAPAAHHGVRPLRRRLHAWRCNDVPTISAPRRPRRVSRQRVWRIRARHVVVAAGAHERPVVFTDNDRPGIMLAHGARTFLHRYGVKVGEQAVVFTTNDSAYLAAFDLHDAGVRINAIVDARSDVAPHLREACAARGITLRTGSVVSGTRGEARITAALVSGPVSAAAAEPRGLRCATRQRRLESGGASVQPGTRQAALRRRPRRLRTR